MSLYDSTFADIMAKREKRERGEYNGVPFMFSKWKNSFDSFDPGMYLQLLGGTGVGKSKLKRFFIYNIIEFSMATGYPVHILDFSLEDERKEVYKKMISHYAWKRHREDLSLKYLNSKEIPLSERFLKLLKSDEAFYRQYDSMVNIVNGATSPNEIHNICERCHDKYGGSRHIFSFLDNVSNITADPQDSSDWEAIKRWSRQIARLRLCKELQMTVVDILQMDFESEKSAFRNASKGALTAIEPNMASIGDSKIVARNGHLIMALFSPNRYDLQTYPNSEGYRIDILRDSFRSLLMLKNSHGEMGSRLPLKFDGRHEQFEEMPPVDDKDALDKLYTRTIEEEKMKRASVTQNKFF